MNYRVRIRCFPALVLLWGFGAWSADGNETSCELDESGQAASLVRQNLVQLMLNEIDDHRYEPCDSASSCNTHIAAYAAQISALDEDLSEQCNGASVWRDGVQGMIDPRELPEGTLQLYGDDPRRQAFYEALVDSRLQASPPDQESLDVILTMGAPGSGKSHVLAILDACQEGVVMVDPDLFKNVLVEYRVAKAAHDRLAADRVHRESSMLAKKLRDAAIASRRDLCIDGVMSKRDTALELIQRLQSHGYDVTIVAAVVPFETAYERVLSRGEATGRFVPYEYAKQAHANIEAHRDELLRAANRGYAFDTSGSVDEQPQLIAQYEAGKPVVVNQ